MKEEEVYKRKYVTKDEDARRVCERLLTHGGPLLSTDLETTGLDPNTDDIRLVSIASRLIHETYAFDMFRVKDDELLRILLMKNLDESEDSGAMKLCFKGDFDTGFLLSRLRNAYIECPGDLSLAALMLNPYLSPLSVKRKDFNLKACLLRECGIEISKDEQKSDWSQNELSKKQLQYACIDVECLYPLYEVYRKKLEDHGLIETWMVENYCQLATAMMHVVGVKSDRVYAQKLFDELDQKAHLAAELIGQKFPEFRADQPSMIDIIEGKVTTINLDSPQQVLESFRRRWGFEIETTVKGETKKTVGAAAVKAHWAKDPELVDLYTDRASIQHMMGPAEAMMKKISAQTGRVHSDFQQFGNPGQQRYASKDPILLNFPRVDSYGPFVANPEALNFSKLNFRDLIVAEEGRTLLKTDFAQLQLCAMAQESGDPLLNEAYHTGQDVHWQTAKIIFELPLDLIFDKNVYKAHRSLGKTSNFALIFLCSAPTLKKTFVKSNNVHKSEHQCREFIQRYFARYKGIHNYHQVQPRRAERLGYVEVQGGRKALFMPGFKPKTEAINFPMVLLEQSGAKLALSYIARWCLRQTFWVRVVLSPFDEIVLEVDEAHVEEARYALEHAMKNSMSKYITKVPINVESAIVARWGGGPRIIEFAA